MPLTPEDVRNIAFNKPPIGKRGYDENEVDAFLAEVEAELRRLLDTNQRLRSRADGASPSSAASEARDLAASLQWLREEHAKAERLARDLRAELDEALARRPDPRPGRTDDKAAAVLQMAQRTAGEHVTDARRDAEALISDATMRAAELIEKSGEKAMQKIQSAQREHDSRMATLESERLSLRRAISELTSFGQQYCGRLREDIERRMPELGNRLMPEPPRPFVHPA